MNLMCCAWFGKILPPPAIQWPSSTIAFDCVLWRFVWVCFLASHTKYWWVFFCSVSVGVQLNSCTTQLHGSVSAPLTCTLGQMCLLAAKKKCFSVMSAALRIVTCVFKALWLLKARLPVPLCFYKPVLALI